jgi:predicted HicB family RNase H-like nuclease
VRVVCRVMAHETTTPTKTVRLERELHARLKAKAALAGMSIEAYLEQIVRADVGKAA